jgi:hypothetical protein
VGASFPVKPRIAVPGEPLCDQCVNKRADMVSRLFMHPFVKAADLSKEFIYGVLPVKELPHADAGWVQAKTTKTITGIGVEENGPVIKLLSEHDERVGLGSFVVFHCSDSGSAEHLSNLRAKERPTRGKAGESYFVGRVFIAICNVVQSTAIAKAAFQKGRLDIEGSNLKPLPMQNPSNRFLTKEAHIAINLHKVQVYF